MMLISYSPSGYQNSISRNTIVEARPFDTPGIIQSLLLVWLTLETSLAAWFHKEPELLDELIITLEKLVKDGEEVND